MYVYICLFIFPLFLKCVGDWWEQVDFLPAKKLTAEELAERAARAEAAKKSRRLVHFTYDGDPVSAPPLSAPSHPPALRHALRRCFVLHSAGVPGSGCFATSSRGLLGTQGSTDVPGRGVHVEEC